tara:strand:+ start:88741 stop:89835 length:1095 start_codon:yes stop_codon:yes gene_type:complete
MENLKNNFHHLLTPPGMGVHTVHTGKEIREKFHQSFYQSTDLEVVKSHWQESLKNIDKVQDKIKILGIPSDTGGGIQRGANWGPLFLRERIDYTNALFELGDIKTIPHLLHDKYLNKETIKNAQDAIYDGADLPVSPLSIAEVIASEVFSSDQKMLSLGGDHSVSYPVVKEWLKARKAKGKRCAIIHFDAHTDLMDQRLGIDICFASWAYHMIELLERPSDILQYGIRSSGQPKEYWQNKLGIQQFWHHDFKTIGLNKIIKTTLDYLSLRKIDEVYISFDIDFLDSKYASSTGTPEDEGLSPHDGIAIIKAVGEKFNITGADLVEVAPFVSSYKKSHESPEPETTLLSSQLILNQLIASMQNGG